MVVIGYSQSNADHTLFIKRFGEKIAIIIVYVDDTIITGDDLKEISHLERYLSEEFEIKDLEQLRYFLGIEVAKSSHEIYLSHQKYVIELLSEIDILGCKSIDTLIEANGHLSSKEGDPIDKGRCQRLVRLLIYLSHTRFDIAFFISLVSQYMHDPYSIHMKVVLHILRYLKFTPGCGIIFSSHDRLRVEAFTDADWVGSPDDRRSTTSYCTFVGDNIVTWYSKKQAVVAHSSVKAKFRAMDARR
ncbi:uncharacterized mitochondrial protein AtMg00810-like [Macadamia integrifolia]|uniref:uncharacterized mitochondrial protein AtMg00810-like n=1 Tax=Macadamia integrifolia TaxID=60698 RepID=UPI001C4E807E|nr:uncharacterized mitochondrial protein AtMg00810-like [Macadamia integrifolia]